MAKLLADKAAVGPLLEFLKNTDVGNRENVREREIDGVGAEKGAGRRRTTRGFIDPTQRRIPGKQICLKAEHEASHGSAR